MDLLARCGSLLALASLISTAHAQSLHSCDSLSLLVDAVNNLQVDVSQSVKKETAMDFDFGSMKPINLQRIDKKRDYYEIERSEKDQLVCVKRISKEPNRRYVLGFNEFNDILFLTIQKFEIDRFYYLPCIIVRLGQNGNWYLISYTGGTEDIGYSGLGLHSKFPVIEDIENIIAIIYLDSKLNPIKSLVFDKTKPILSSTFNYDSRGIFIDETVEVFSDSRVRQISSDTCIQKLASSLPEDLLSIPIFGVNRGRSDLFPIWVWGGRYGYGVWRPKD